MSPLAYLCFAVTVYAAVSRLVPRTLARRPEPKRFDRDLAFRTLTEPTGTSVGKSDRNRKPFGLSSGA